MKSTNLLIVLVCLSLNITAYCQQTNHSKMSGKMKPGSEMQMKDPMTMGSSGMKALKGLKGKEFNIAFLSQMIAHHQGAVEMAKQSLKVATHAETKKENHLVIDSQMKQIAQMTAWLKKWYGVKPSMNQAQLMKHDMHNMMSMMSMMSMKSKKMTTDQMFFEMMIPHHEGAILMSRLAEKQSDKSEVKQIARDIIKDQLAEIARYKQLLKQMS